MKKIHLCEGAASYVSRSATGRYHLSMGPSSTNCSYAGQSRYMSTVPAQPAEVLRAGNGAFCKKCFSAKGIELAKAAAGKLKED